MNDYAVELPRALENIQSDDCEFEIVVSNNTQKLILYNKKSHRKPIFNNVVSKQNGVFGLAVYKPDYLSADQSETKS